MDDDENLSMLLAMGFPDIGEIKKALRMAKNDINEAVAILTNEQPLGGNEIDMHDMTIGPSNQNLNLNVQEDGFPTTNLYELEQRVFQDDWSIPYKKEESLGKCLIACTKLIREDQPIDNDAEYRKFIESVMPEAFRKLLTSNATSKWHSEIQEGIYTMLELFIEFALVRLPKEPVPVPILNTLGLAFDVENDWNYKNRNQLPQGPTEKGEADTVFYTRRNQDSCNYGWLCDLVNHFGNANGFTLIQQCLQRNEVTGKEIAALLKPLANCATILSDDSLETIIHACIDSAFGHLKRLGDDLLKTKEASSFSDIVGSLKVLCHHFRPELEETCDVMRLDLICRMLRTPLFNTRMNGLKEVSKLIDESDRGHYQTGRKHIMSVSTQKLADWMASNSVLSVALEGNLDQTQYVERLKAIVEFLGPRLGKNDVDRMWYLLDTSTNSQIIENVHVILATAASKLNFELYEHLTKLIKKKWEDSDSRVREKLLRLIGQIGREAKQTKSVEKTLQVLWEVSHLDSLPRHLLERALSEQLAIITEMNFNKENHRRTYTHSCVEDIKTGKKDYVLPSIIHLHKLCKSVSRASSSFYQKADKAFLGELNSKHDIVKLLCASLGRCHLWGVEAAITTASALRPELKLDGRYTYEEYIEEHLKLLKFFLQEGNLYLSWEHSKGLWETLAESPRAAAFEKEYCYNWFKECISDLESDTQMKLFEEKLLSQAPDSMSNSGFLCFKDYFESVNIGEGKLRKGIAGSLVVDSHELVGYQFLWNLVTDTHDEAIATEATEYLLKLCFISINSKMRKDQNSLHHRFIEQCADQLRAASETSSLTHVVQQGYELESSSDQSSRPQITAPANISFSKETQNESKRHQIIRRVLHLAVRYVCVVEGEYQAKRCIAPHAATFYGKPVTVKVLYESKKDEFDIHSHNNQLIGVVKRNISEKLQQPLTDLIFECGDSVNLGTRKDNCLLSSLQTSVEGFVKINVKLASVHATTSNSMALMVCDVDTTMDPLRQNVQSSEDERSLPGVLISSNEKIFLLLYSLATLKDPLILAELRKLLHLIPSDPSILEELENNATTVHAAADFSPKVSPRKPSSAAIIRPDAAKAFKETLFRLLDPSSPGMSAVRVLYNLEMLSSRLLPISETGHFEVDGCCLRAVLRLFNKNFLPHDTDHDVRQSIYVIALQLARFLLCGEGNVQEPFIVSSAAKPTPPKKSALDHASLAMTACRVVEKMTETEFLDMANCLMGVAWAAGAGDLQLLATSGSGLMYGENNRHPMRMLASRRSRDSSTGSSTGSDGSMTSNTQLPGQGSSRKKLMDVDHVDALIASDAFDLLTTCLQLRKQSIAGFFALPNLSDFIVETLLGSPSAKVRVETLQQLKRIANIRCSAEAGSTLEPIHHLTKLILKTPVPLWMPSCKARGMSHQILGQCGAYFELRCHLLQSLTADEHDALETNVQGMLEDELTFLHSYTSCPRKEDCILLEGHLRLVDTLLTSQRTAPDVGRGIIKDLLDSHLFPASKLILEGSVQGGEINPKCDTLGSRTAAYNLLIKLANGNEEYLELIVSHLVKCHHDYDESLAKEFNFEPLVERRAASDFVGLKNAGATCYMNSVLQQLYNVPGLCTSVLKSGEEDDVSEEETILHQLQNVFGHLLSSKLQYYTPDKFWHSFKLFGQPVNLREQQDAFEFYTQIIDQVDEFLKGKKKPKIFPSYFEGIFSDMKICQECPHRFEREQSFMALNLTVKSSNLLESLEQFVRGELLDGDNAYFCEKCEEKRSAIKTLSIRQLPKTLVIQLKRFHYDWETNRAVKFDDYFEFPRLLDMGPYTTDGIRLGEKSEDPNDFKQRNKTSARKSKILRDNKQPYDLVGIVVHSGQANAGHYYSFIKNRYSSGCNEKWFKFNDTTVEEIDMTDDVLRQECFGGNFKVKKSPGSSLPEDRQRYWNAYMLFYESRGSRKRPVRSLTMSVASSSQAGPSRKVSMPSAPPRESLSQLSDLLEKGEKTGLFSTSRYVTNQMPSSIEQAIQEENLRFLLRRDVLCEEYYKFVSDLISVNSSSQSQNVAIQSGKLATFFLLNSYAHLKKRQKSIILSLMDTLETYLQQSQLLCQWLISFLASSDGLRYFRPFLLECDAKDVRSMFSRLVSIGVRFYHNFDDEPINKILETLANLIKNDASSHIKHCGQIFSAVHEIAKLGFRQTQKLLELEFLSVSIKLLLGIAMEDNLENVKESTRPRKWTVTQNRELGELHATLAALIRSCHIASSQTVKAESSNLDRSEELIQLPKEAQCIIFGAVASSYIREAVSACREVSNSASIPLIIQGLIHASTGSTYFCDLLMEEILKQYCTSNSSELRNLSSLLIDILAISDKLQSKRIDKAIYGSKETKTEGLLQLIDQKDSCRAYQCIKTLVTAANRSPLVKDKLLEDPAKWQWAVNWLKEKMEDDEKGSSILSNPTDVQLNFDQASNEDSLTRTFHRTTSAVVTLAEANAILAEFDSEGDLMEVDSTKQRLDEDEDMPELLEMKE